MSRNKKSEELEELGGIKETPQIPKNAQIRTFEQIAKDRNLFGSFTSRSLVLAVKNLAGIEFSTPCSDAKFDALFDEYFKRGKSADKEEAK